MRKGCLLHPPAQAACQLHCFSQVGQAAQVEKCEGEGSRAQSCNQLGAVAAAVWTGRSAILNCPDAPFSSLLHAHLRAWYSLVPQLRSTRAHDTPACSRRSSLRTSWHCGRGSRTAGVGATWQGKARGTCRVAAPWCQRAATAEEDKMVADSMQGRAGSIAGTHAGADGDDHFGPGSSGAHRAGRAHGGRRHTLLLPVRINGKRFDFKVQQLNVRSQNGGAAHIGCSGCASSSTAAQQSSAGSSPTDGAAVRSWKHSSGTPAQKNTLQSGALPLPFPRPGTRVLWPSQHN